MGTAVNELPEDRSGGPWVLVTRHLEPQLAPVLDQVVAVVSETGSALSHLAILAREAGLATVAAVPDALRRFPPGTRLRVDGTSGEIDVLGRDPAAGAERAAVSR